MIIQKVVASRDKDWLDLEALLLEQYGKLDENFVENWLAQFAEALETPQILTKYRQLVERIKAKRSK